jgi:DNA replication protein DnaC
MLDTVALPLLLKQLNLSTINQHWEEFAKNAQKQKWTYPQYLKKLVETEVATRHQNRIQRRIKESKLPTGKTLDTFNPNVAKSINPAQIKALAKASELYLRQQPL